jgi:hypothetical protein
MIAPADFLANAVQPAILKLEGKPNPAAERLLMGTAAHESNFIYTRQLGNGPALGYFQMEPATHDDCWKNYISFRAGLKAAVLACAPTAGPGTAELMVTNSIYAAAMARVRYMRAPGVIPMDLVGIAHYWKDIYNTPLGAGTTAQFLADWNKYLLGVYPTQ